MVWILDSRFGFEISVVIGFSSDVKVSELTSRLRSQAKNATFITARNTTTSGIVNSVNQPATEANPPTRVVVGQQFATTFTNTSPT